VNGEGHYLEPTHDTNSSKSFECLAGVQSPDDRFRLLGYMKAGDGIGSSPAKRRDEIAGIVIGGSPHPLIDIELTGFLYVHGYTTDDLVELATKWGIEIPTGGEDIQFANYNPFLQEDIDPDNPGRKWTGAGGHIKVRLGASEKNQSFKTWMDSLSLTMIFSLYDPDKDKESLPYFKLKNQFDAVVTWRASPSVTLYARYLYMNDEYFEQETWFNSNYLTDFGIVMKF
jgi:hypothetical protein